MYSLGNQSFLYIDLLWKLSSINESVLFAVEREKKELTTTQTKASLSTKKKFTNDKTIKSKAEADRRMKEVFT